MTTLDDFLEQARRLRLRKEVDAAVGESVKAILDPLLENLEPTMKAWGTARRRDFFAASALAGLLGNDIKDDVGKLSVIYADEVMKELDKC